MKWRNLVRGVCNEGPLLDYYRFGVRETGIRFRQYDETDFDRCCELYSLCEKGRFPPGCLRYYEAYLKAQDSLIIVAENEDGVIASGGIGKSRFTPEIVIAMISFGLVHPDWHRKGIGTQLFCASIALLQASRDWTISMTSAGNGTERFFERLGFVCCGQENDEEGHVLYSYVVKVLGEDVDRFQSIIFESGEKHQLELSAQIPEIDRSAEWEKLQET